MFYDSEYGRASHSADVPQSERKTMAANTQLFSSSATSLGVSAASTGAQPSGPITQEYAGYGNFNPSRMLAIQAGSDTGTALPTITNDGGPTAPAYKATAANSEPVATRRRQPSDSSGEFNSTLQSADQLLDEVDRRSTIQTRAMKRKGSGSEPTAILKRRKQLEQLTDAAHPAGPRCTNCIAAGFLECNGKSHCNRCAGKKCVYILCTEKKCKNLACLKIHPFQYDLGARRPGEPRRHVLHDNLKKGTLSQNDQTAVQVAMSLLNTVPPKMASLPLARLPVVSVPNVPRPRVLIRPCPPFSNAPHNMPNSISSVEQRSNTGMGSEQLGHSSRPFEVPEAVRSATLRTLRPAMSDPALPSPAMTNVVPSRSTAFSTHTGPSPFMAIMRDDKRDAFASRSSTAFGLQPASSAADMVGSSLATGSTNPYMAGMNGSASAAGSTMFGATFASPYMPGSQGTSSWATGASASGTTRPNLYGTLAWNPFRNTTRPEQSQGFGSNSSTAGAFRFNPSAVDRVIIKAEEDDD